MTTEVIEGEAVEVPSVVAVLPPQQSLIVGGAALASMSDEEFEENLASMRRGLERIKRIQTDLLIDGEDYGKVPGVARPFLQKPGAEKLGKFGGYAVSYRLERHVGDPERPDLPDVEFVAYAQVHLGDTAGPIVAEGVGEANSHETKHRYRRGERVCPNCGKPAIIKGKAEYGGGWVCFKKKDGCNSKWPDGSPEIEDQSTADIENADPWDLANTLAKMAKKRAFVDGMLTATATSGLFTQDDDSPSVSRGGPVDAATHPVGKAEARTEPWLDVAGVTRTGVVSFGSPPVDGNLRQTQEGGLFGFKLAMEDGTKIPQVVMTGALALAAASEPSLDRHAVTASGDLWRIPWDKNGKAMPAFQRLIVTRLETADWSIPGPLAATEAPEEGERPAPAESGPVARCGVGSPYEAADSCGLEVDHSGMHKSVTVDGEITGTWPA